VDALIEQQKGLFDIRKRNAICREIDGLIAQQCPYVLLWNINAVRLLYWNKFDMPSTVLGKFSDESAVTGLWWFDEDAAADLAEAMESGLPLPARPETVVFENVFRPPQAP
jgi:microcin C transport system substrate-binding protein